MDDPTILDTPDDPGEDDGNDAVPTDPVVLGPGETVTVTTTEDWTP